MPFGTKRKLRKRLEQDENRRDEPRVAARAEGRSPSSWELLEQDIYLS
jgi:hypothetical protein